MRLTIIALVVLAAFAILIGFYAIALRRRLRGAEDPVLWLPRRERRAHARKLLAREQQQHDMQVQQDLDDYINNRRRDTA